MYIIVKKLDYNCNVYETVDWFADKKVYYHCQKKEPENPCSPRLHNNCSM